MEPLFQPFLLNGYDDMDFIHQIMRSSEPLSLRHLEEIGIKKPGHRVRVLALLEDEILRMRKSLAINPGFNCCVAPAATNYHSVFYQTISMQNWLEALQLGFLSRDFVNSGYDDMEHMLMLMNSSYPITEDVLKNDIKIDKLGYRHRILTKLKEDSNPQRHRKFQTNLQIDKTSQNSACEFCVII